MLPELGAVLVPVALALLSRYSEMGLDPPSVIAFIEPAIADIEAATPALFQLTVTESPVVIPVVRIEDAISKAVEVPFAVTSRTVQVLPLLSVTVDVLSTLAPCPPATQTRKMPEPIPPSTEIAKLLAATLEAFEPWFVIMNEDI